MESLCNSFFLPLLKMDKIQLPDTYKSVQKGKKILCPQCQFEATQKSSLQRHIKSIHEGQTFSCSQCEYKATQKGDLQKHIRSVHEGQMFPSPHCTAGHEGPIGDISCISIFSACFGLPTTGHNLVRSDLDFWLYSTPF